MITLRPTNANGHHLVEGFEWLLPRLGDGTAELHAFNRSEEYLNEANRITYRWTAGLLNSTLNSMRTTYDWEAIGFIIRLNDEEEEVWFRLKYG